MMVAMPVNLLDLAPVCQASAPGVVGYAMRRAKANDGNGSHAE